MKILIIPDAYFRYKESKIRELGEMLGSMSGEHKFVIARGKHRIIQVLSDYIKIEEADTKRYERIIGGFNSVIFIGGDYSDHIIRLKRFVLNSRKRLVEWNY